MPRLEEITVTLEASLRAAGVPLVGLSLGRLTDQTTWHAQLTAEATPAQQATADALIAAFDLTTVATHAADVAADNAVQQPMMRALVAYLYKTTHGTAPTGPQLAAELQALKAISKALP